MKTFQRIENRKQSMLLLLQIINTIYS